jgi:hypothetical protein
MARHKKGGFKVKGVSHEGKAKRKKAAKKAMRKHGHKK